MGDEITMRGYRALTFVKYTTIMRAKLAVTSGLVSSFDYIRGNGIGSDMVLDRDDFWCSFAKPCDL
jgi:hypothetical protein